MKNSEPLIKVSSGPPGVLTASPPRNNAAPSNQSDNNTENNTTTNTNRGMRTDSDPLNMLRSPDPSAAPSMSAEGDHQVKKQEQMNELPYPTKTPPPRPVPLDYDSPLSMADLETHLNELQSDASRRRIGDLYKAFKPLITDSAARGSGEGYACVQWCRNVISVLTSSRTANFSPPPSPTFVGIFISIVEVYVCVVSGLLRLGGEAEDVIFGDGSVQLGGVDVTGMKNQLMRITRFFLRCVLGRSNENGKKEEKHENKDLSVEDISVKDLSLKDISVTDFFQSNSSKVPIALLCSAASLLPNTLDVLDLLHAKFDCTETRWARGKYFEKAGDVNGALAVFADGVGNGLERARGWSIIGKTMLGVGHPSYQTWFDKANAAYEELGENGKLEREINVGLSHFSR